MIYVSDNSWERVIVGKFLRASAAPLSFHASLVLLDEGGREIDNISLHV